MAASYWAPVKCAVPSWHSFSGLSGLPSEQLLPHGGTQSVVLYSHCQLELRFPWVFLNLHLCHWTCVHHPPGIFFMCWVYFSSYVTNLLTSQFCHLVIVVSVKIPCEHSARTLSHESCSWPCCLAARLCLKQCHRPPSFVSLSICVYSCCLEYLVLSQFQMLCSRTLGTFGLVLWLSCLTIEVSLRSFSASWAVFCCLPCSAFVDGVKS